MYFNATLTTAVSHLVATFSIYLFHLLRVQKVSDYLARVDSQLGKSDTPCVTSQRADLLSRTGRMFTDGPKTG